MIDVLHANICTPGHLTCLAAQNRDFSRSEIAESAVVAEVAVVSTRPRKKIGAKKLLLFLPRESRKSTETTELPHFSAKREVAYVS